jgi:1-acyl-sn-glycerol-3-phosphate acyltransferase
MTRPAPPLPESSAMVGRDEPGERANASDGAPPANASDGPPPANAPDEHPPANASDGPPSTITATGGSALISRRPDFRDHLPGLEPDRRVTDWGRSEAVDSALDRTVFDFLYHYWFRVEVEGVDNVPGDGPALLIANHAGVLPTDATMIAKAIRVEHRRPRPLHFATERVLGTVPGVDMLLVKAGGVAAHPANLHRLLFDERQLVLVFPEGAGAKPLRERYRLRPFRRLDLLAAALRAGAPIVPVAVLGAEEAAPMLGRLPTGPLGMLAPLRRLPRLDLAVGLPLPAKIRIRFLSPVDPRRWGPAAGDHLAAGDDLAPGDRPAAADEHAACALADDLRALIQENLLEMVAQRRSVWLG